MISTFTLTTQSGKPRMPRPVSHPLSGARKLTQTLFQTLVQSCELRDGRVVIVILQGLGDPQTESQKTFPSLSGTPFKAFARERERESTAVRENSKAIC